MTNKDRNYGEWVFMFPISNLSLTDVIKNELKIGRVTFITFDKFKRNKRKFDVYNDLKSITSDELYRDIVDTKLITVALIKLNGEEKETLKKAEKEVNETLYILATSQLFYKQNGLTSKPYVFKSDTHGFMNFSFHLKSKTVSMSSEMRGTLQPLTLNQEWVDINKHHFFFNVIRFLDKNEKDFNDWEKSLIRSLIFAGKSNYEEDIGQAFLFRMIAMESVITGGTKNHKESFVSFFYFLIGWHKDWVEEGMENKIDEIYRKRNDYVHDGNPDKITTEDLIFTEKLLFNLYRNLFKNLKSFTSKAELKNIRKKHESLVNLGLENQRTKFLPKGLSYTLQYKRKHEDFVSSLF